MPLAFGPTYKTLQSLVMSRPHHQQSGSWGSRLAQQVDGLRLDMGLCPGSGDCSLWELEKGRGRVPRIPAVTSVHLYLLIL